MTDRTHNPAAASWVESANDPSTDFPLQNLPLGVFRAPGGKDRIGVAIGDRVLDLAACDESGYLNDLAAPTRRALHAPVLNSLIGEGRAAMGALRLTLFDLLAAGGRRSAESLLMPMAECEMQLPVAIGDYTDFYASRHHAANVGALFRPDNPLLPNYTWIPIGYHGRSSSIVVSGTDVVRPSGQTRPDQAVPPAFGPSRSLDYEVEIGAVIGTGNALGEAVPLGHAEEHLAGLCLVNDWSARDVQAWEYQPLGPFLAKDFATTLSPWLITIDALSPFRVPRAARPDGDPQPLSYLDSPADRESGAFDIVVEAWIRTAHMTQKGEPAVRLSRGAFRDMYWTIGQMVAHHTSNGCNLRPGDLLASGTVSGPTRAARGCLLEITSRGKEPVILPGGESRSFLADGDELTLRAWCEREGARRIGFGECRGVVKPAR
ncbi:MAG TPA: fumarylacetoacetase [Gemmatimonadaceae bacterium]|nr:fumarylacetoacetase [Gemmatimonadaceae bacterium]